MAFLWQLLKVGVVLVAAWAALVWGLPPAMRLLGSECVSFHAERGICDPFIMEKLLAFDAWVGQHLRPFAQRVNMRDAVDQSYAALGSAQAVVDKQGGAGAVGAAVQGVNVSLATIQNLLGDDSAGKKLQDVPANAQRLLAQVEVSLENLRVILDSAGHRAEDVSNAVNQTRSALDTLSSALPQTKNGTGTAMPVPTH